ncbi:MAG: VWA domain-containing protein, partial [Actinobacteria bacterium]|nr:VWA domain-containing protein [Actinomycetota bacterium]
VELVDSEVQVPDVSVYIGVDVPSDLARPFLAIAPPGGVAGVEVVGVVETPIPTLLRSTDALLAGLDLSGLRIVDAQIVDAPTAETLVGAEGAPLILRGRRAGTPFVYVAFDLGRSNLPLDVSFPVFGDRLLAELADANSVPVSLQVGRPLVLPVGRDAVVSDPTGSQRSVAAGSGSIVVDRPGFWTVEAVDAATNTVAVSLPAAESDLSPLPVASTSPRLRRPGESIPTERTSLRWVAVLLAIVVAGAEYWLARTRSGVSKRQWKVASALRIVALVAAVVGLVGVSLPRSADAVTTVFVLDRSDSVGDPGHLFGNSFVDMAVAASTDGAQHAVVVAGNGARVERLLAPSREPSGLQTVAIDPGQTDLAAALRLAGAVTPDDARRRIVVVSDGRSTVGDAAREASLLAERGIELDYVTLIPEIGSDASVLSVQAPRNAEIGQVISFSTTLSSSHAQPALVSLRRDGEIVSTVDVLLNAGTTTVVLQHVAGAQGPGSEAIGGAEPQGGEAIGGAEPQGGEAIRRGGLAAYDVVVDVALDARPQNDVGRVTVDVAGPAGVLLVEGAPGVGETLEAGLGAGGLVVETIGVAEVPSLDRLAGFDSVVLVDVDADDLSEEQMVALASATRDLGVGLVTVGGTQSYGMGAYRNTVLESVLPVISDVLDPRRRRTVAEVLAIDTSESMGECHCADGFEGSGRVPGGLTKTDIARTGAARAIDALHADDEIGILGIDTDAEWLIDLQQIPSADVIDRGLARITPSGQTDLSTTLSTAAVALRQSNAGLKHIILFSDGFTQPGELAKLATEAGELFAEGITVSVIATGEGAANELRPIATAGGGRFYPGRDLSRIPEILVQESIIASRSFINEGEFLPTRTGISPATEGLTSTPPLLGYVATTAQTTARTLLTIGDESDPLLATWQAGLGRATSWTSDAGLRWGQAWVDWDGYVDFWSAVVRDTFSIDGGGSLRATVDGDELRLVAERPEQADQVVGGAVTATVTDPDGVPREVPMVERADGRLEGSVHLDQLGAHAVSVTVATPDGPVAIGTDVASLSYSSEYRPGVVQESVLARLSELTGGRGAITADMAFDADGLTAGTREVKLGSWLLIVAVIAWLLAAILSRLWLFGSRGSATGSSAKPPKRAKRGVRRGQDRDTQTESGDPAVAAPNSAAPSPVLPEPPAPPEVVAPPSTMDELLRRKRDKG